MAAFSTYREPSPDKKKKNHRSALCDLTGIPRLLQIPTPEPPKVQSKKENGTVKLCFSRKLYNQTVDIFSAGQLLEKIHVQDVSHDQGTSYTPPTPLSPCENTKAHSSVVTVSEAEDEKHSGGKRKSSRWAHRTGHRHNPMAAPTRLKIKIKERISQTRSDVLEWLTGTRNSNVASTGNFVLPPPTYTTIFTSTDLDTVVESGVDAQPSLVHVDDDELASSTVAATDSSTVADADSDDDEPAGDIDTEPKIVFADENVVLEQDFRVEEDGGDATEDEVDQLDADDSDEEDEEADMEKIINVEDVVAVEDTSCAKDEAGCDGDVESIGSNSDDDSSDSEEDQDEGDVDEEEVDQLDEDEGASIKARTVTMNSIPTVTQGSTLDQPPQEEASPTNEAISEDAQQTLPPSSTPIPTDPTTREETTTIVVNDDMSLSDCAPTAYTPSLPGSLDSPLSGPAATASDSGMQLLHQTSVSGLTFSPPMSLSSSSAPPPEGFNTHSDFSAPAAISDLGSGSPSSTVVASSGSPQSLTTVTSAVSSDYSPMDVDDRLSMDTSQNSSSVSFASSSKWSQSSSSSAAPHSFVVACDSMDYEMTPPPTLESTAWSCVPVSFSQVVPTQASPSPFGWPCNGSNRFYSSSSVPPMRFTAGLDYCFSLTGEKRKAACELFSPRSKMPRIMGTYGRSGPPKRKPGQSVPRYKSSVTRRLMRPSEVSSVTRISRLSSYTPYPRYRSAHNQAASSW